MKIGIDIDGVIIDFERNLKTYAELFDLLVLNKDGVICPEEQNVQERFEWNEDDFKKFINKYFLELTETASFLPGVKDVVKMLKGDGHELIIISARGGFVEEMMQIAKNKLDEAGLKFDKYYWKQEDKLEIALKEKLDFIIDDNAKVCKKISENNIRVLYLRDKNMPILKETPYLKDVDNWGQIYRFIYEYDKINNKND